MSATADQACMENFRRILESLELIMIQPQSIHYDRPAAFVPRDEIQFSIKWSQAYRSGDPEKRPDDGLAFHPRYTVDISCDGGAVFTAVTIIDIVFRVKDQASLDQAWADEQARSVFLEKQIRKTLWPVVRQQALDGLSRLGLPAITLPWILD